MISRRPVETIIASYSIPRVTYLFHQNWRPEELANVESMSCSRMNSRCRSQSCDDCVDPGINGLHCPLTQCITQDASFDMESTRPSEATSRDYPTCNGSPKCPKGHKDSVGVKVARAINAFAQLARLVANRFHDEVVAVDAAELLCQRQVLRPARLASYSAISAALWSSSGVVVRSPGSLATPMLAPMTTTRSAKTMGSFSFLIIRAQAESTAAVSRGCARITQNSSPPSRAARSVSRISVRRRPATSTSTASPAPCPTVSLIALKPSRSMSSSAKSP